MNFQRKVLHFSIALVMTLPATIVLAESSDSDLLRIRDQDRIEDPSMLKDQDRTRDQVRLVDPDPLKTSDQLQTRDRLKDQAAVNDPDQVQERVHRQDEDSIPAESSPNDTLTQQNRHQYRHQFMDRYQFEERPTGQGFSTSGSMYQGAHGSGSASGGESSGIGGASAGGGSDNGGKRAGGGSRRR